MVTFFEMLIMHFLFLLFFSERRVRPGQVSAAVQGRLRDPEGDRARRLRGGLRRQAEGHRPRLRPQDPEQVGDAEAGGDGVLPGGAGRAGVGRPPLDHQPPLRIPGRDQPGE